MITLALGFFIPILGATKPLRLVNILKACSVSFCKRITRLSICSFICNLICFYYLPPFCFTHTISVTCAPLVGVELQPVINRNLQSVLHNRNYKPTDMGSRKAIRIDGRRKMRGIVAESWINYRVFIKLQTDDKFCPNCGGHGRGE